MRQSAEAQSCSNTTIVRSNYLWDESAHLYEHAMKLWENITL